MKTILSNYFLSYLRFWSSVRLSQTNAKIIGVTGSVGKSSCVYILSSLLSKHFKLKTTYHGNSQTGLPLELLDLREDLHNFSYLNWLKVAIKAPARAFTKPDWEVIVAEMGIDGPIEPQNMSYLLKIIKPHIGIFLNVAPVHTEQFMSVVSSKSPHLEQDLLSSIATEKGLIVTTLPESGYAILNIDYPQISQLTPKIKAIITTIGEAVSSDYRLIQHKADLSGTYFKLHTPDGDFELKLTNQLLFRQFASNLLASLAAAKILGLDTQQVVSQLAHDLDLPPGRQTLLSGQKDSLIIDSSYNASSISTSAFLDLVHQLKPKGQKILCLGDMNELGHLSEAEHQEIARQASKTADTIVLIGEQMFRYAYPIIRKSSPKLPIFCFQTSEGVGDFISSHLLTKQDLIFVKGSQNRVFTEQVVSELISSHDKSKLCRQSAYWDQTRSHFFKQHPNRQLNQDLEQSA